MTIKDVPDLVWQYYGVISFMNNFPSAYTMDDMRSDIHDEVAKYYNVERYIVSHCLALSPDAYCFHINMKKHLKNEIMVDMN